MNKPKDCIFKSFKIYYNYIYYKNENENDNIKIRKNKANIIKIDNLKEFKDHFNRSSNYNKKINDDTNDDTNDYKKLQLVLYGFCPINENEKNENNIDQDMVGDLKYNNNYNYQIETKCYIKNEKNL